MSRITKWKLEKTKVKVVFRLQFHATHIPQTGWDKLFISFFAADSGKAIAKTTKANVRNGTCKWGDPIYETTRLLQDIKSKQYDQKLYKLVVAMGSSRSNLLGEANINLADYGDASKPSAVALPLHGCDSGAILHVTVQLLTSKTGFREFEQQRELREMGLQSTSDQNSSNESSGGKLSPTEEAVNGQQDKVNPKHRYKDKIKRLHIFEGGTGINGEYAESAVFDGSSNASESLHAEKQDTSSTHELDSIQSSVSGDLTVISRPERTEPSDHRFSAQGTSEWVHGWGSDYSADNDLAIAHEENIRLRGSLEVAESSILELKLVVSSLQNHADEIGIESQNIVRQLSAEISSGEELAKEVSILKLECSMLKSNMQWRNSSRIEPSEIKQDKMCQDLQLRWLKGVLVLEDKVRELHSKVCTGYHERDFRFMYTDIEALLSVLQNLKNGTQLPIPSKRDQLVSEIGFEVELCQPELSILHKLSRPEPGSQDLDCVGVMDEMKGKMFELLRELDDSKVEKEGLIKKMDQMECYYESLIQELEENQRLMLCELQAVKNDHSNCIYTVSSTKAEMERMCQGLNEEVLRLSDQKQDLDSLNKELQRRAISAESALKRARLNYSVAVNQLQKDLELLSVQVLSMFETNENLIKQAFAGTIEDRKLDFVEVNCDKYLSCQSQCVGLKSHNVSGNSPLEDLRQSFYFHEGVYKKVEEEVCEMYLLNVYFDVLSTTLEATLLEESANVKQVKETIDELAHQLELSTESRELLMQRLTAAIHEIHSLNEYKNNYNNVALQNRNLEAKLLNAASESCCFVQKITEMEYLMEACTVEKIKLENLLKCSVEDMKVLKTEFNELASLKDSMENSQKFVHDKLLYLLSSCENKFGELPLLSASVSQGFELKDMTSIFRHLEELKHSTSEKIHKMIEDNKGLADERDMVQASLTKAQSDMMATKHKFELDIHDMVEKFNVSNISVQNLQLQVESIANKLNDGSKVEEIFTKQQNILIGDLDRWERELEQLLSRNKDLADEILAIDNVTSELETSKLKSIELEKENQILMASLQARTEEVAMLASGLDWSKKSLQSLHDENQALLSSLSIKTEENAMLESELNSLKESLQFLHDENQASTTSLQDKIVDYTKLVSDFDNLRKSMQFLHDENQTSRASLQDKTTEHDNLSSDIKDLTETMHFLQEDNRTLTASLQDKTKECSKLASDLNDLRESVQSLQTSLQDKTMEHENLASDLNNLRESMQSLSNGNRISTAYLQGKTLECAKLETELNNLKESIQSLCHENEASTASLGDKTVECVNLSSELNNLRECMQSLGDKHQASMVSLQDRNDESVILTSELSRLKEKLRALHNENQALSVSLWDKTDESSKLESELITFKQNFESLHDELNLERGSRDKLEEIIRDLASKINEKCCQLLHLNNLNSGFVHLKQLIEEKLEGCHLLLQKNADDGSSSIAAFEAQLSEVHEMLVETNEKHVATTTELGTSISENRALLDKTNVISSELNEYKNRVKLMEASWCDEKCQLASELQRLKKLLVRSEEEMDSLSLCNEELEIRDILLKSKVQEQHAQITSLEARGSELLKLQNQCNDLKQKISQQILEIDELKNTSTHLKQIKEKADSECAQAGEKREGGVQTVPVQDSLRVAFMKEQYETKIQDFKQQMSMSKRHSEEMLWKLQDAIDEIDMRKKSEASHLKKNEELGLKILELEAELESLVSYKREKVQDFDMMKAELECSLISLECCKQEKQIVETSLRDCKDENTRISIELISIKELLKNCTSNSYLEGNVETSPSEQTVKDAVTHCDSFKDRDVKYIDRDVSINCRKTESAYVLSLIEADHSSAITHVRPKQDSSVASSAYDPLNLTHTNPETTKYVALFSDDRGAECLKSSMDRLNKELERMKNENSDLQNNSHFDSKFPGLQRELMQLQKANEDLGSMFPSYNEFSIIGNAVERVLALEIELAESLQQQKKSGLQIQSSLLNQHNDEKVVLQSFRDINNLIKDMLEMKGRYADVESELKDMHDRYSQLSLQFAEVEGERQKLMMTLKNLRSSRKSQHLRRSLPSSGDY